jgi:methylmalonyl-CoA mutase N-terminal domain/subunit
MQVESGDRKIVGVNHGVLAEEAMPPVLKPDPNLGLRQRDKLDKIRANRNNDSVSKSLQEIRESATSDTNLFPLVIEALKHDCTLGEIVSAMKDVFGTWMPPSGF